MTGAGGRHGVLSLPTGREGPATAPPATCACACRMSCRWVDAAGPVLAPEDSPVSPGEAAGGLANFCCAMTIVFSRHAASASGLASSHSSRGELHTMQLVRIPHMLWMQSPQIQLFLLLPMSLKRTTTSNTRRSKRKNGINYNYNMI